MKAALLLAAALAVLQASSPAWGHQARPRREVLTGTIAQTHSARTSDDRTRSAHAPRSDDRTRSAHAPRSGDRSDSALASAIGRAREEPRPEEAAREAPRPGETARVLALGALAIAALVGAVRRRRWRALALVAMLAVLTFESGVHSAHHLDSPADAARCAVAATASHTPGLLGDVMANLVGPGPGGPAVLAVAEARPVPSLPRSFQSRAPPLPSPTRV